MHEPRGQVDRAGIVRAAGIDLDYTRRPEPEKTVADVAGLWRGSAEPRASDIAFRVCPFPGRGRVR